MKLSTPQTYAIEIPDEGPYRLFDRGEACKFSKPASNGKHPKLYTLSAEGKLIYVGIASQSMASRLSFGFRVVLRELETVEAEVAFLCRQQSGQWPAYQTEIHFYPSGPVHRKAASQIYAYAVKKSA